MAACGGSGTEAASTDAGQRDDAAAAADAGVTEARAVRVLFIGNSYTSANGLPSVVARLAETAPSPVRLEVGLHTPGGQTWEGHDADPALDELIGRGWDYVVLQDQSQQPWWGPPTDVKPALLSLDEKIRAASAQTVLFMTWAREGDSFSQDMLVDSYYEFGGEAIGARVAPVGRAWERALRDPSTTLHAADGSHPNVRGTYLAACVLYATLTGHSPMGLGDGGLDVSERDAEALQRVARETMAARRRPDPPLLGEWPLSSAPTGNDLVPGADLVQGDAAGPDGSPGSATGFAPTAYAGIPYFEGINTPHLTVSFEVYRADWSRSTEHREYLVARDAAYEIYLEGSTLSAAVFTRPEDAPAATPTAPDVPARSPPPPPSTELTFASDGLSGGWHRVTLTLDGVVDTLWVDGTEVASAPAGGAIACDEAKAGCMAGVALGVESESTVSLAAPDFAFTGAMSDLRIYDVALTAAEIRAL